MTDCGSHRDGRRHDAGARVSTVHRGERHAFSKPAQDSITLLEGLGVEGDAHCGRTVQNRYQIRQDRHGPNLRQVHLIAWELLPGLAGQGFTIRPGDLGENISTLGLDMSSLMRGSRLRIGADAIVEVTGLRTPCVQIDRFREGLKMRVATCLPAGRSVLKSGVMGIVVRGGVVRGNDPIAVDIPCGNAIPLEPV